ncbi:hypothetical protein AAE478_003012 [Parahypoxylon ruwenzoriense]
MARDMFFAFFYLALLATAGIFGYFEYSHDIHGRVNASLNLELSHHHLLSTPILTDSNVPGFKAYGHIPTLGHQHPLANTARPLITYAYTESPSSRENLMFFLDNGLHGDADFVFILNGATDVGQFIPGKSNIHDNLWKKYSRFITLDAVIRGPFVPRWSRSCWSDVFLSRVTKDVKLVGTTANCLPKFHIHSMIWATDSIGMELLLNTPQGLARHGGDQRVALGGCYRDKVEALYGVVQATTAIKEAGYQVDALMAVFHESKDYGEDCAKDSLEDILWDNKHYYGTSIHPYETLFVTVNHDTDPITIARLTEWHYSGSMNGSWDVCG